jgi:hypothetical protein
VRICDSVRIKNDKTIFSFYKYFYNYEKPTIFLFEMSSDKKTLKKFLSKEEIFKKAYPKLGSYELIKNDDKHKKKIDWVDEMYNQQFVSSSDSDTDDEESEEEEEEEKVVKKPRVEQIVSIDQLPKPVISAKIASNKDVYTGANYKEVKDKMNSIETVLSGMKETYQSLARKMNEYERQLNVVNEIVETTKRNIDGILIDMDQRHEKRQYLLS